MATLQGQIQRSFQFISISQWRLGERFNQTLTYMKIKPVTSCITHKIDQQDTNR